MDVISINYELMKNIGNKLEDNAQTVKAITDELRNQMQVLQGGAWIADAADAFYSDMNDDAFQGMTRLFNALNRAKEVCSEISARYEAAEQEAEACVPSSLA